MMTYHQRLMEEKKRKAECVYAALLGGLFFGGMLCWAIMVC